ncbi:M18 family aminopeptidase [Candidatus Cloacimonadaceae bacterium]
MDKRIKDLMALLDGSGSRFQASLQIKQRLDQAGFSELKETEAFKLKKGDKHYILRQDTAILAFIVGTQPLAKTGFNLAASHIDSPALKLKPATLKSDKGVLKCGVEVYGGPIINTWIDRELSLAGKVIIKTAKGYKAELIDLKEPVAIIPNAAIHLNRKINEGFEYNKQTQLQALLSVSAKGDNPLYSYIADSLDIKENQICESELYLYDATPSALLGLEKDMLAARGLDNLAMTHAILSALISANQPKQTVVGIFFDHEEIGSTTPQGADSSLLGEVLERLCLAQGLSREDYYLALRNSFLISADMAHAYHPSYADKYEPDYSPIMNKGPVIKINANHRYASTAESTMRFMHLCEHAKVPCQKFLIRSDMPCGSTVGPIVAAALGLETVDIGNPIWAMHSIRETGGTKDHLYLIKALEAFFS